MMLPPPFDPRAPSPYPGFPPSAWALEAAVRDAQGKLRMAALVTIGGGCLIFMVGFFLAIFAFVTSGAATGALFLVFGVIPGLAIVVAGALMQRPGGRVDGLVWIAAVCGVLALFSSGGLVIGSILTFVGAGLASSAARALSNMPAIGPARQPLPLQPSYPRAYSLPPPPVPAYGPPPPIAPLPWASPQAPPAPRAPPAFGAGDAPLTQAPPAYSPLAPPAPSPAPPPPAARVASLPTRPKPAAAPEPAALRDPVRELLAMDAHGAFDFEALNALDFAAVKSKAGEDRELGRSVAAKADELRQRLEQDLGDLETVDDILRDRVLAWYRDSPADASWTRLRPPRWSGLVAESRTAGGARTPPLTSRLASLRDAVAPEPIRPVRGFIKSLSSGARDEADALRAAGASAALPAQVVQAVLDDLAAARRAERQPLPLLRLSELASKATPAAVTKALADLFKGDARGAVVVLHPSRFPGFDFVMVRPPPAGAKGAAIAYELVCAAPDAPAPEQAGAPAPHAIPRIVAAPALDVSSSVWQTESIGPAAWAQVLEELERRRERLAPPPANFRKLPAYFELRKLLLTDPSARRTFLAVKWRGKPPGIGLVASLLQDGRLAPDVETDCEYLEAELSDIERGDVNWRPTTPRWNLADGVTVARAGGHGAFRYEIGGDDRAAG